MLIYYPFHAHPADVEEMIQIRLEERTRCEECENGLWPKEFRLGEYSWAGASRVSSLRCAYYRIDMESLMN